MYNFLEHLLAVRVVTVEDDTKSMCITADNMHNKRMCLFTSVAGFSFQCFSRRSVYIAAATIYK